MLASTDIKSFEEFKELKPHEAISYLYNSIIKYEDKHMDKEILSKYLSTFLGNIQEKISMIIEAIQHEVVSEDDFKKLVRTLEFGQNEIFSLYHRFLEKVNKKNYDQDIFGDIKPAVMYSKVFDKVDELHKGKLEINTFYKYLQNKKITSENQKNIVFEAFVKMEANKLGAGVSRQTFVNYCKGNCTKGFDDILLEIINVEGFNQKVVREKIEAMNIPEEQYKKLCECFKLLDIAKEGSFTKNNFDTYSKSVHIEFSKQELSKIFKDMHSGKEILNVDADKIRFFSYMISPNVDKKFAECIDKIYANHLKAKEKNLETDEQFKQRTKISEDNFKKFSLIFEFLDQEGSGKIKFKHIQAFVKKHSLQLSTIDGSKAFKEMHKPGGEEGEASRFEFIEYMNIKKNIKLHDTIISIVQKEGGLDSLKKKLKERQSSSSHEKATNEKAPSKAESDLIQEKVSYFYNQIVKKANEFLTMDNLKAYLTENKLSSLFSLTEMKTLFSTEKKIKKESILNYCSKNKKFQSLFEKITSSISITSSSKEPESKTEIIDTRTSLNEIKFEKIESVSEISTTQSTIIDDLKPVEPNIESVDEKQDEQEPKINSDHENMNKENLEIQSNPILLEPELPKQEEVVLREVPPSDDKKEEIIPEYTPISEPEIPSKEETVLTKEPISFEKQEEIVSENTLVVKPESPSKVEATILEATIPEATIPETTIPEALLSSENHEEIISENSGNEEKLLSIIERFETYFMELRKEAGEKDSRVLKDISNSAQKLQKANNLRRLDSEGLTKLLEESKLVRNSVKTSHEIQKQQEAKSKEEIEELRTQLSKYEEILRSEKRKKKETEAELEILQKRILELEAKNSSINSEALKFNQIYESEKKIKGEILEKLKLSSEKIHRLETDIVALRLDFNF